MIIELHNNSYYDNSIEDNYYKKNLKISCCKYVPTLIEINWAGVIELMWTLLNIVSQTSNTNNIRHSYKENFTLTFNYKIVLTQEINRHILEFQVLSRYGRDDLQGGYKRMDYALNNLAANFFMNKLPVHISPFQKVRHFIYFLFKTFD